MWVPAGDARGCDWTGGRACDWTEARLHRSRGIGRRGLGCDAAERCSVSIRSLLANGLENGVSANRALSVLQAAAALPIKLTRAIRDTATQCPEPTR